MKNHILIILFTFVLSACGGGSDDSDGGNTTSNTTSGMVQLGAVKEAQVNITSLDGLTSYYSTTTNVNGFFDIDREELRQAVNSQSPNSDYLKLSTVGGIDIDPDDDGNVNANDYKSVAGAVMGVIRVDDLLNKEQVNINLISTAVADLLQHKTTIIDEDISMILDNLNMADTNNDGVVNNDDIISYDMVQHDSGTETKLRYVFLDLVHEGDDENRDTYIESLQQDKSYITRTETEANGKLSVTLDPINDQNHIRYAVSVGVSEDQDLPTVYQNETISLSQGEYLYYQECKPDNNCFYREFVYYDGEETTNYYPIPHIGTAYSDPDKIAELRLDYLEQRHYFLNPDEYKAQYAEDMDKLKSEISTLEGELKTVEDKIAELES